MNFTVPNGWSIHDLRKHLQFAVDLEFWTIPFYLSVMYSIEDRNQDAYQLIRTVVDQEMLHLQSACNIANAYGHKPTFEAPEYIGQTIPHINVGLDNPKVVDKFKPYTATIGPLDIEHANAMCLIEIPENLTMDTIHLKGNVTEYGSIGEFYAALRYGAAQFKDVIRGNVSQVDFFSSFYRNAPNLTVTENGENGFQQVNMLIDLIVDQGEGADEEERNKKLAAKIPIVPYQFQNTADDNWPEEDHFEKFLRIKELFELNRVLPKIYHGKPTDKYTEHDKKLEKILIDQFTKLRATLKSLFGDDYTASPEFNMEQFFPVMATVGGAIRNCWMHGVTPKYS